ncbi:MULTISPECIES: RbsD/FucU family protein [unclassified Paenibacillus]|uniref:RbsD/FucU family protein n=1 Tax=unclassified Paenibacillus TaxID=185978 RepID=UPI0009547455|nr:MULTISPECIES: RbsD/FucU family protein [unclassified Paenibacillus]ASS66815.1 fucose isomerase [Paenibacillus sp. RUD330]SIP94530.1 L-fucose mutarotase [Paenibacillus sp. RU4X]SIQ12959.1 L-fucose mutarotase [Paenibacillus sp. RU4T]
MLKGIPPILSPELLSVLRSMGHGDELVLADGNFPAASHAARLVRADGHSVPELLEAILSLLPLDDYVDKPAAVMAVVPGDPVVPAIWEQYRKILNRHESREAGMDCLDRQAFYERARSAYAVVATGESAQYANLILVKGVVRP